MTWFKVDDAFWRHRKVRKLGRDKLPAIGLWQLAGTWCCDNILTNVVDGFVPREQVKEWDPRQRYARRLVDADLWEEAEVDGERGYLFHDWPDYQPTKATVEAEREEWRNKKANQRKRKEMSPGDTPGDSPENPPGNPNGSPPRFPVPVPVPVPVPLAGDVGRGASGWQTRGDPPPPTCPKHRKTPAQGPCGPCGDARRTRERYDADQAKRRDQLAAELEHARTDPGLRCHHGTDGGLHKRSDTNESPCALCRTENATRSPA